MEIIFVAYDDEQVLSLYFSKMPPQDKRFFCLSQKDYELLQKGQAVLCDIVLEPTARFSPLEFVQNAVAYCLADAKHHRVSKVFCVVPHEEFKYALEEGLADLLEIQDGHLSFTYQLYEFKPYHTVLLSLTEDDSPPVRVVDQKSDEVMVSN